MTGYAKMIDDMCKILQNRNLGTRYGHLTVPVLLLMDDITLKADSAVELQTMLDMVHHQAMKYHVRFGANKCKVMSVAEKSRIGDSWNLGKTQLTTCTTYKYLGETISNDCTLKTHLEIKAR